MIKKGTVTLFHLVPYEILCLIIPDTVLAFSSVFGVFQILEGKLIRLRFLSASISPVSPPWNQLKFLQPT